MHLIQDHAKWEVGLLKDIDEFKMSPAMSINEDLIRKYPELKINVIMGSNSGITKNELLSIYHEISMNV